MISEMREKLNFLVPLSFFYTVKKQYGMPMPKGVEFY